MEDYKPGTTSALTGAKDLIEEQKDNLLGEVGISDPTKVQAQGVQADALRAGLLVGHLLVHLVLVLLLDRKCPLLQASYLFVPRLNLLPR